MSQISKLLLPWFNEHKRLLPWREDTEPYHVWLSEIMLQQTRVEAVKSYYIRFIKALPMIDDLADCPDDDLMKLWEGLGYYNRARNLKKTAQVIMTDYGGEFPRQIEQIRSLPGIGEYTAGAVASICFGQKTPAIDGNVLRVTARLLADRSNIDIPATRRVFYDIVCAWYPERQCGDFTQALMELGALICIPNGVPKCEKCPLSSICQAHLTGCTDQLPVRNAKRERKHVHMSVFVMRCQADYTDYYAIRKRTQKGLLHGLYEFYNVEETFTIQQAMQHLKQNHIEASEIYKEIKYTHVFTHVEWHMTAYYVEVRHMDGPLIWAKEQELMGQYALPTAFRVFFDARE